MKGGVMKTIATILALIGFTFVYDTTSKSGIVYVNNGSQDAVFLMYPGNHCVMFTDSLRATPEKCTESLERFRKMNPSGITPQSYIVPAEVPK